MELDLLHFSQLNQVVVPEILILISPFVFESYIRSLWYVANTHRLLFMECDDVKPLKTWQLYQLLVRPGTIFSGYNILCICNHSLCIVHHKHTTEGTYTYIDGYEDTMYLFR